MLRLACSYLVKCEVTCTVYCAARNGLRSGGSSFLAATRCATEPYKKYAPKEKVAYYNLDLIYLETERVDLAIAELKTLLRLNPNDTEARSMMDALESDANETKDDN